MGPDLLPSDPVGAFPIFTAVRSRACDAPDLLPHGSPMAKLEPALCLPLLQVSAVTTIESGVATTVLSQRFSNPTVATIREATYTFPV